MRDCKHSQLAQSCCGVEPEIGAHAKRIAELKVEVERLSWSLASFLTEGLDYDKCHSKEMDPLVLVKIQALSKDRDFWRTIALKSMEKLMKVAREALSSVQAVE